MKTNERIMLVITVLFAVTTANAALPPYVRTMRALSGTGPLTQYVLNGDIVIDTVTTLMWQRTDGGEMTWAQARTYCDTLTSGGYSDWRLPSSHELFSINDLTLVNPAIPSVFERTGAEYWWSADTLVGDGTRVWCTNAGGGLGPHPMRETISAGGTKRFHVRAVRDQFSPSVLPAHFIDQGGALVNDKATDRDWMQFCLDGSYTYTEALAAADTVTHGGFSDWRLPTIKELQSLNIEAFRDPSLDLQFFPCIASTRMLWSATPLVSRDNDQAWILQPETGIVTYALRTTKNYVLCVRGGAPDVTSVGEDEHHGDLPYPNPASDHVSFGEIQTFIVVLDLNGRVMTTATDTRTVSVDALATGTYLVCATDAVGTRRTSLIVKY